MTPSACYSEIRDLQQSLDMVLKSEYNQHHIQILWIHSDLRVKFRVNVRFCIRKVSFSATILGNSQIPLKVSSLETLANAINEYIEYNAYIPLYTYKCMDCYIQIRFM